MIHFCPFYDKGFYMSIQRFFLLFLFVGTLLLHANIVDDFIKTITPHKGKHFMNKQHRKVRHPPELSEGAQWQTALGFLGYYRGKIDGDLSTEETFRAVTAFHIKCEQVPTGFLEEEEKQYLSRIYRTIHLSHFLAYEGRDDKVYHKKLQAALALLSLYDGKIDGYFGKKSIQAFALYRRKYAQEKTAHQNHAMVESMLIQDAKQSVKVVLRHLKEESFVPQNNLYEEEENLEDIAIAST